MASTCGCSFFRYRALEEPNIEVTPRSIPRLKPAEEVGEDIENAFQEFHGKSH